MKDLLMILMMVFGFILMGWFVDKIDNANKK